jgi:hypothetical protein
MSTLRRPYQRPDKTFRAGLLPRIEVEDGWGCCRFHQLGNSGRWVEGVNDRTLDGYDAIIHFQVLQKTRGKSIAR